MARDSKRLAVQFASRLSSYFVIELIMQADGAQMVRPARYGRSDESCCDGRGRRRLLLRSYAGARRPRAFADWAAAACRGHDYAWADARDGAFYRGARGQGYCGGYRSGGRRPHPVLREVE